MQVFIVIRFDPRVCLEIYRWIYRKSILFINRRSISRDSLLFEIKELKLFLEKRIRDSTFFDLDRYRYRRLARRRVSGLPHYDGRDRATIATTCGWSWERGADSQGALNYLSIHLGYKRTRVQPRQHVHLCDPSSRRMDPHARACTMKTMVVASYASATYQHNLHACTRTCRNAWAACARTLRRKSELSIRWDVRGGGKGSYISKKLRIVRSINLSEYPIGSQGGIVSAERWPD